MAVVGMHKTTIVEEQNLLMLMTMHDSQVTVLEAREFLQIMRAQELKKLKRVVS
jgi:hypothetical protein